MAKKKDSAKGLNPIQEDEITLEMRLENLKSQQSQLETAYQKVQGAIEFCEALMEKPESEGSNA